VLLAITVFVQRHQRMFVADGRTDGFAIARTTNIALLGNVRQKLVLSFGVELFCFCYFVNCFRSKSEQSAVNVSWFSLLE